MWVPITEEDLLTVLSGPELQGYRAAAKASGQLDPVQPTIDQVTDYVRGFVGGCKRNTLGKGNTIPEKLMAPALDILAVRIPQRVGRDPKPGRDKAADRAVELLKIVARCEFDIEEPVTATSEVSSSPSPSISARVKSYGRESQDGI